MQIREADVKDAPGIAKVHVDNWISTYYDVFPAHVFETWTYKNREERWKKSLPEAVSGGTRTYVAEEEGKIAAFALAGTTRDARLRMRYTGEFYGIYVHPDFQRQGLGRKLLESCAEHLASQGHKRAALWVIENNKEQPFFEKMGGEVVYEAPVEIGGNNYKNIAYGWEDIQSLLNHEKLN